MKSSFHTIELSDGEFEFDGLRFLTVKTPNLEGRGDICLYVPGMENLQDLPIYILLHGVYGSAWIWALKGGVHKTFTRLIKERRVKPAIIAMPSDGLWGDGSAYFEHNRKDFESWIVHDVPLAVKENIPEASSDSEMCIGGLSMGGYGALCLGSKHRDLFKAISAHSSVTKLEQMTQFVEEDLAHYSTSVKYPYIVDTIRENGKEMPALRFDCGVDDQLIGENRLLHNELEELDVPHLYEEFEGGHEWPYWQKHVEKTLLFFDDHCQQRMLRLHEL